nr:MAG TPA: hypothetical protein [Caudoviricetes sp.]DAJ51572.1 MAG TPA: hypothetical protein [Caudoviricetes sp.]
MRIKLSKSLDIYTHCVYNEDSERHKQTTTWRQL